MQAGQFWTSRGRQSRKETQKPDRVGLFSSDRLSHGAGFTAFWGLHKTSRNETQPYNYNALAHNAKSATNQAISNCLDFHHWVAPTPPIILRFHSFSYLLCPLCSLLLD